jgi:hypothetical protein
MNTPRFSILALEPDPTRAINLRQMLCDRVDAEIVLATTSEAAIEALSWKMPDVVLTSALVGPEDDARFMAHLRQLESARQVPVLTVPPVVDEEPPRHGRNGTLTFFKRAASWRSFDRAIVAERIVDALAQARSESLCREPRAESRALPNAPEMPAAAEICVALERTEQKPRPRAHRWERADVGWLTGVQTRDGLELTLLNISRSGALVESSAKFLPNSSIELRLCGAPQSAVLPVRVVRSEVANVSGHSVRYRAAVVFGRKFDLIPD